MLALVVVVTSGCLSSVNADEVRDGSLAAMEDVETYRFEMEMNMTMDGLGGEMGGLSVGMTGEGVVNESSERMRMSSTVDMGEGIEQETYVVNDTVYTKSGMDENGWYKMDSESEVSQTWNTSAPAGDYEEILEISDVSHEGTETVDGESAYVLRLDPDPDEYTELLKDRLNGATSDDGLSLFGDGGATVDEASARYWISEETGHVLRTESEMDLSFGGSSMSKDVSATVELDLRMYDHGDDITVELPDEARDAREFGSGLGDSNVSAGTDLGEIPDEEDVDRRSDEMIDRVEYEVEESEAFGKMRTAKVYFQDGFEAESLAVEGLKSGASAQTDSPGTVNFLSVVGVEEGETIAVTATKEDGTVVRQTTTYDPDEVDTRHVGTPGNVTDGNSTTSVGGAGVDAGTDLGEVPDKEDVDRTSENIVEEFEFDVRESDAFGETHTVKVRFNDSFDAETLAVEGLESGASAQTDSAGAVNYLSTFGIEEGETIAVTATKEDGTVVRQTTTYEP